MGELNTLAVLTALAVTVALMLAVVNLAISNARITSEKNQKVVALNRGDANLDGPGSAH